MSRFTASLLTTLSAAAIVATTSANAEVRALEVSVRIPASNLDQSLSQYIAQTRQQILYSPQMVRGKRSNGLTGTYTPDHALTLILQGSGLHHRRTPSGAYVLEAEPTLERAAFDNQPEQEVVADQPLAAAPPAVASEDIVVTGSRVIRNGNSSPSPVTVVSTEDLQANTPGSTLADALNTLPAFAGSRGSSSNPTTVGSAAGGNGSANQLNLRNLGATRTLVLMDGHRIPPTLFNGVVDVDIIPQMLVQRVDIVTGGVSAVYGSDAMSGVVNYVINRKFNGLKIDTSYGLSEYGDGSRFDAGAAYGTQIGNNLHAEISYEFRDEAGIDRRSSRSWLNQIGVTGAGTTANPYVLQSNLRQNSFPFGGLITSGALSGQNFASNGVLVPFVRGTSTGTSSIDVGGDGGYWDSGLIASLRAHQLFGRIDYDAPAGIHAFIQGSATLKTNRSFAETNQLNNVTISRTNAFLPAAYQALIPTTQPTFTLSKFLGEVPRVEAESDSKQWIVLAGIDGNLGGAKWAVSYTHGRSALDTDLSNVINRQNLSAALDAVNSNGQVVCNITVTNPGLANGCVPLNVFGPNAASAAAIDYVTDTVHFSSVTTMDNVSGEITGSPFSTWAGPVSTALSGEWRKISYSSRSSSTPADFMNCTGLRYNCSATSTLTESSFGQDVDGHSLSVWEVAGEFDLPLLKDVPFFQALNLNGAARYTKYNVSGSYWTWKIGGDWQINDMISLRATRSRDIRAPTLFDLYAPLSIVQVRALDLYTNTTPTVSNPNYSNPNLTAEIGNTLTGGIVVKPMRNLSFAIDGYRIKITDAITQINGQTPEIQQACYASGGSSPYCALQNRPFGLNGDRTAANQVRNWSAQYLNIASVETWGFDFEANYTGTLFNNPMSVRLLAAYQPHIYFRQPGLATIDQGGVAFGALGFSATPSVRITGYLRMQPADGFTIDIMQRWRNAMKLGTDGSGTILNNRVAPFATTSVNFAFNVPGTKGNYQFYFNVQNLFDATPPPAAFVGNGTRAGLRDGFALGDDPRGRYYTAGVRLKF